MKENMKKNKIFFVFSLVFTLVFVYCASSMAAKNRLPINPYNSYITDPHKDGRINNLDEVVHALNWDVTDDYNIAYTLLSSTQTYVIYDEDIHYESPDMNDNGDIVYVKEDGDDYFQVFLLEWENGQYDLNNEEQITDDDDDCDHLNPGINNQGDIVWEQEGQIFLYTDQNIVSITDVADQCKEPMINSRGEIVYAKLEGSYYQIFSTDRGQITFNNLDHQQPDVNDKGEIIWREEESGEWQIFSNVRNIDDDGQLTDDDIDKRTPSINNNDILVWTEEDAVFWEDLGSINWDSRVEPESDSNTYWWELDGNQITQTAYDNGSFEIEDFEVVGDRAFWKYSEDGGPHYYCYYDLIYQGYYDGSNYIKGYKRVTQEADGDWSITGFDVAGDRAFWKYSEDGGEYWFCYYDLITNEDPDRITQKASSEQPITNFTVSGDRAEWRYNGYNYYSDLPDGDIIRVSSGGGGGWNPWTPWTPWTPSWTPTPWTPSWIPSLTPSWTSSWIPSLTSSWTSIWTPSWNTNWNSGWNTSW